MGRQTYAQSPHMCFLWLLPPTRQIRMLHAPWGLCPGAGIRRWERQSRPASLSSLAGHDLLKTKYDRPVSVRHP